MSYLVNIVTASMLLPAGAAPGVWRANIRDTSSNAVTVWESATPPIPFDAVAGVYEIRAQRFTAADEPVGPAREVIVTLPLAGEMIDVVDGISITQV